MGADKISSRRRWKLLQDELGFQHTSLTHHPIGQIHIATGVLLNLGTNFQPYRPENAAEHQTSSPLTNTGQTGEHHRSDRSLLVKLGDFHRKAPHRSDRCNTPSDRSQLESSKTPNRPTELQIDPNPNQ
jgi:hypothetical protein